MSDSSNGLVDGVIVTPMNFVLRTTKVDVNSLRRSMDCHPCEIVNRLLDLDIDIYAGRSKYGFEISFVAFFGF